MLTSNACGIALLVLFRRHDKRSKAARVLSQIPEQALLMFAAIARQVQKKTLYVAKHECSEEHFCSSSSKPYACLRLLTR